MALPRPTRPADGYRAALGRQVARAARSAALALIRAADRAAPPVPPTARDRADALIRHPSAAHWYHAHADGANIIPVDFGSNPYAPPRGAPR